MALHAPTGARPVLLSILLALPARASQAPPALGRPAPGDVWATRAEGAGGYRDATELSGRAEVARFLAPPANARDLDAVCLVRREAEEAARSGFAAEVLALEKDRRDLPALVLAHHDLGQVFAYDGRMADSVREIEAALRVVEENGDRVPGLRDAERYLATILGTAHLRRGEVENCLEHRNVDRCLFPLRPAGQHQLKSGSPTPHTHSSARR